MANPSTDTASTRPTGLHWVLHRWPSALGLAAAVGSLLTGSGTEGLAITLSVAVLCYLGAAALNRRWIAWAGILIGSLVVVASGWVGIPWWAGLGGVALVLVVVGLFTGASRPALTAQTLAMLGFGGLAVLALFISPRVGLVLVALTLASHAVWDVIHLRRNIVVPRSLAEFCILLDVPLGIGLLVLAW